HQAFTWSLSIRLNSQLKLNLSAAPICLKYSFVAAAILLPTRFTCVAAAEPVSTFELFLLKKSLSANAAWLLIVCESTSFRYLRPVMAEVAQPTNVAPKSSMEAYFVIRFISVLDLVYLIHLNYLEVLNKTCTQKFNPVFFS